MLLELAQWLARDIRAFSVFNYITLRAVLAALTALLIGLAFGPLVIRKLAQMKIGQAVRTDGPQTHLGEFADHAHHGRCADPDCGGGSDPAVG
jgi:phospho-N-acetylmuramoyl-pentapeptide-transferase